MKTTLKEIKHYDICANTYEKLNIIAKGDMDTPLNFKDILAAIGIEETLWILKSVKNEKDIKKLVLFSADMVEMILPIFEKQYKEDNNPRKAVAGIRDFINNKTNVQEIKKLRDNANLSQIHAYNEYLLLTSDENYNSYSYNKCTIYHNAYHSAFIIFLNINLLPNIYSYTSSIYGIAQSINSLMTDGWEKIEKIFLKYI